VLVICVLVSKVLRAELRMVVPVAAVFVALCAPANFAFWKNQAAPWAYWQWGPAFCCLRWGRWRL